MNKISREDLVERRKRELQQKELENDVKRDMRITFQRLRLEEQLENSGNPLVTAAIRFFVTLCILYVTYILIYLGFLYMYGLAGSIFPDWVGPALVAIDPIFHALIWTASIYSVYRKKSVITDLIEFFIKL